MTSRTVSFSTNKSFTSQLASYIYEIHRKQLPDLSQIKLFIPNTIAADQLKNQLISNKKLSALIPPYIGSMNKWIKNNVPLNNSKINIIDSQSRQLLFIDAITQHPDLFKTENNWQVCEALLNLFDEMTGNNVFNSKLSAKEWEQTLNDAYGLPTVKIHNLKAESNIIFTLWKAWHKQMQDMEIMDEASAYASRLKSSVQLAKHTKFYVIGPEQLNYSERKWLEKNTSQFNIDYVYQNRPPCLTTIDNDKHLDDVNNIDFVYDKKTPLKERSKKTLNTDKLNQTISIYAASSYEQEAQAVELQTRLWLLEKRHNIAIVTEDRKIARRVRALLDRAGVSVQDTAGWALSTTSASTTIERWLECIEEDFPHQALLDLLKSPFFCSTDDRQAHLEQVYHFEYDIVIHENIARDISRYQKALKNRMSKLANWPATRSENIKNLLDNINHAATDLLTLHSSKQAYKPEQFLDALLKSLDELKITTLLNADPAGKGILSTLNNMQSSLRLTEHLMTWKDFRTWLAYSLENEQLTLNTEKPQVKFMNFKQAQYCTFDAIIIAGANKDKLPGNAEQMPFFNQSVRSALGLKDWSYKKSYFFYRFKCLLESADTVLITYRNEHNGEWLAASPWVTSLENIKKSTSNSELNNKLTPLISKDSYITDSKQRSTIKTTEQPLPTLTDRLKPEIYSASKLQKIINCPYQFFTHSALSLKASDHISEELKKSEYGEKIHSILFSFHQQDKKNSQSFTKPINSANREKAIQHLITISRDIFNKDIEDNIQHRSWLKRWLKTIPAYIDWQINWQASWTIDQLETEESIKLDEHASLKGRLDRVDKENNNYSIIDYKTGSPPSNPQIISGEDIQLLSYASLIENTRSILYLKLDQGEAKSSAMLDGELLDELESKNKQRIINIVKDINKGSALNAWGDTQTCERCDSKGICRKQVWENA
ncbi:MAG: PD-(D/E)XK nuclease family protein [Gammaproteobacteria bacterium]|nr:PD-(D/E)XK nuclease family protein [Gammaproteobacteria bacterium]